MSETSQGAGDIWDMSASQYATLAPNGRVISALITLREQRYTNIRSGSAMGLDCLTSPSGKTTLQRRSSQGIERPSGSVSGRPVKPFECRNVDAGQAPAAPLDDTELAWGSPGRRRLSINRQLLCWIASSSVPKPRSTVFLVGGLVERVVGGGVVAVRADGGSWVLLAGRLG
jgi:hypothetical protein